MRLVYDASRPDWLTEPCPSWCSGDHRGQDHPSDRWHHSDYLTVPVIERQRILGPDIEDIVHILAAEEVTIVVSRAVEHHETWAVIATDQGRVEVTLESMRRIHRRLGELLDRIILSADGNAEPLVDSFPYPARQAGCFMMVSNSMGVNFPSLR